MKKKILSIILSLTMLLGVIPFAGLTVSAVSTVDHSKPWYVDENGNEVQLTGSFWHATDGMTFSYDCKSWLYVEGHCVYDMNFHDYNIGIVLADGAELEMICGIVDENINSAVTIYGQSEGTGKLKITNSGSNYRNSGNIIVNDCTVEVETTYTGQGGFNVLTGNITVNGGKFIVNATATNADVSTTLTAIAYNSGNYVNNKLKVNGGYVEINVNNSSRGNARGIWGSSGKNNLEINGGRVIINATGKGSTVYGIQFGNVTVNGGNLDITGTYTGTNSTYSGYGAYNNAITVNGGTASFTGKNTGSGKGYGAQPTAVSVSGTGEVTFNGKTQALYSVKNEKVTAPTSLIQTSADGESGWTKWNGTDALANTNFKGIKMTPHSFKYAVSEDKLTATCEEGEDCALGYGKNPLTLNINGGNFDAEELSVWKAAGALTPVVAPTAKTELVYNEQEQTGVEAGTGYTLTGTTKATAAGTYTATATLKDGYIWTDATTADKTIEWKIGSAHTHSFTGEYVSNGDGTYSRKCTGCDEVDTVNKITVTDYHILSGNCETNDGNGAKMGHQDKIGAEGVGRAIICLTQADLEKITEDTVTVVGGDKDKQTTITLDCAYTYFYAGDTKYEAKDYGCAAFLIIDHNANNEAISGYGYYAVYNGDLEELIVDALFGDPVKTVSFKNVDGHDYYPIFDQVPEGVHFFTADGVERIEMTNDIAYAKVISDNAVIHTVRNVKASWGAVFDINESHDCFYPYDANVSDDFKSKMLLPGESVATLIGNPYIRTNPPTVNDFDIYAINNMIFGQSNGASFWSNTMDNAGKAVCYDCKTSSWKTSSINESLNVLICRDF